MARSRFFKPPPRREPGADELRIPARSNMDEVRRVARNVEEIAKKHDGRIEKAVIRATLSDPRDVITCAFRHLALSGRAVTRGNWVVLA